MSLRQALWQRASGAGAWPLAWVLAACCALPWLLSERWDGHFPTGWLWGGWAFVAASLALCCHRRTRLIPLALGSVWAVLLTMGAMAKRDHAMPTGMLTVEGVVQAPWIQREHNRTGRLRLSQPAPLAGVDVPVSLPAEGLAPPEPGTPIRVRGALERLDPGPSFLGERPLWRARNEGAIRRLRLRSAAQLEILGPARPSVLLRLQVYFHRRLAGLPLSETARDLWGALTLGTPPVHPESYSPFTESGTIHVLVVSGLQITLVMAVLERLWRLCFRRWEGLAACLGGLGYGALVGFTAPVWRGLIMGMAWTLTRARGWGMPPALFIHGALLLWLVAHPASGADPGFLLAWAAMVGLLWDAEPLAGCLSPLLGRLAGPVAKLSAPWLTTLPLLALFHGGAPLWGLAANVVVLPIITVLTPLCLVLTVLPWPWAIGVIGPLLSWIGERLVPTFARVQPLATGYPLPWLMLLLGWLGLAHRHGTFRRTRAWVAVLSGASLLLVATRGIGKAPRTLVVEAIDVGQGDALLIRAPGSEALLVDTGPSPWSARRIARVLSHRGVREPIHLVITHPHGDHAGGWATLARLWSFSQTARPDVLAPETLWGPFAPPPLWRSSQPVLRGASWQTDAWNLSVRWPPKAMALQDANMVSIVLRLRWQNRELWLMGDALGLQEEDLLDLGEPGSHPHRVLKVAHHGSGSASTQVWVSALRPEVALVSAASRNAFGFPHQEVRDRLERLGCQVLVSGEHGGIQIRATPSGWAWP